MRDLLPLSVVGSYPLVLDLYKSKLASLGIEKKSTAGTAIEILTANAVLDQLYTLAYREEPFASEPYEDNGLSVISSGQPSLTGHRNMVEPLLECLIPDAIRVKVVNGALFGSCRRIEALNLRPRRELHATNLFRETKMALEVLHHSHDLSLLPCQSRFALKLALVGPSTLFFSSVHEHKERDLHHAVSKAFETLVPVYANLVEELLQLPYATEWIDHVQIDEPILSEASFVRQFLKPASRVLTAIVQRSAKSPVPITLHVCGRLDTVNLSLLEGTGIAVLDIETARSFRSAHSQASWLEYVAALHTLLHRLRRSKSDIEFGFGCIDVLDWEIESDSAVEQLVRDQQLGGQQQRDLRYAKFPHAYVSPDCGLRDLPLHIARGKLRVLRNVVNVCRDEIVLARRRQFLTGKLASRLILGDIDALRGFFDSRGMYNGELLTLADEMTRTEAWLTPVSHEFGIDFGRSHQQRVCAHVSRLLRLGRLGHVEPTGLFVLYLALVAHHWGLIPKNPQEILSFAKEKEVPCHAQISAGRLEEWAAGQEMPQSTLALVRRACQVIIKEEGLTPARIAEVRTELGTDVSFVVVLHLAKLLDTGRHRRTGRTRESQYRPLLRVHDFVTGVFYGGRNIEIGLRGRFADLPNEVEEWVKGVVGFLKDHNVRKALNDVGCNVQGVKILFAEEEASENVR